MGPAPKTMAVSPRTMPDRVMPCSATARGSARAATRGDIPSGRRNRERASLITYPANPPPVLVSTGAERRSHCDGWPSRHRRHSPHRGDAPPTTASPGAHVVTPSPTAATIPVYSCPPTAPGLPQPSIITWRSDPQMPQ